RHGDRVSPARVGSAGNRGRAVLGEVFMPVPPRLTVAAVEELHGDGAAIVVQPLLGGFVQVEVGGPEWSFTFTWTSARSQRRRARGELCDLHNRHARSGEGSSSPARRSAELRHGDSVRPARVRTAGNRGRAVLGEVFMPVPPRLTVAAVEEL